MAFDLPPQAPDATPPPAIVAPAKAAEPIHVDSHGFHYTVRGNILLPDKDVVATIEAAETPKDAIESLRAAYLAAGYFLIAYGAKWPAKSPPKSSTAASPRWTLRPTSCRTSRAWGVEPAAEHGDPQFRAGRGYSAPGHASRGNFAPATAPGAAR
jgi:hypothetical protein